MNFNDISADLINVLSKYKSLLIIIKGSPDPDAIASSFALKAICDSINIHANIISLMQPSLPQNRVIINDLNIPIKFEDSLQKLSDYDSYAVTDFQSVYIKGLSEHLPCIVHIDHHDAIDEEIKAEYNLINNDAGSTSSILALIIKELEPKIKGDLVKIATALTYGIQTDTDNLEHATHMDYIALDYLSKYANRNIIKHVTTLPFSKEMLQLVSLAIGNKLIYKDWIIAGIGFLQENQRDSIAIIADFLLKKNPESKTVVVYALIVKKDKNKLRLDASFRSREKDFDLNELIKKISEDGGGRKYKGAYQVNLDYFADCPDKDMLWNLVSLTSVDKIKRLRDEIYLIKLKSFYYKIKHNAFKFFKKQEKN